MKARAVPENDFLYKRLAGEMEAKIRRGEFRTGEKLPSLRNLKGKLGLSLATVYQAYLDLEAGGLIEVRPKSGFYVRAESILTRPAPRHSCRITRPRQIRLQAITSEVVNASLDPELIALGASTLSPKLLPHKHLSRIVKELLAERAEEMLNYAPPEGDADLRRLLAVRLTGLVPGVKSRDVLITNGCMEGVALALQALVKPGRVVAVESPTHFGFLQLLRALGIRGVAVPTDSRLGMDPQALAGIIDEYQVKAVLTIPNFHNPLGALMPEERKKELVRLTNERGVALIEDDIYGEMYFQPPRPSLLKSYDQRDLVITCSSVSKVLAPGFRIGWCIPGNRFGGAIKRLKAAVSMASPTLQQRAVARFLSSGAFDRYLRSLRTKVQHQLTETAVAVQHHFPKTARFTVPRGGNMLWTELPPDLDGAELYRRALSAGVSIVPGSAFTLNNGYKNYIRLSATAPFDERMEKGVALLGGLIREMEGGGPIADSGRYVILPGKKQRPSPQQPVPCLGGPVREGE